MDRMGTEPILPVEQSITINTMMNLNGDGVGMCKQTLIATREHTFKLVHTYQHRHRNQNSAQLRYIQLAYSDQNLG